MRIFQIAAIFGICLITNGVADVRVIPDTIFYTDFKYPNDTIKIQNEFNEMVFLREIYFTPDYQTYNDAYVIKLLKNKEIQFQSEMNDKIGSALSPVFTPNGYVFKFDSIPIQSGEEIILFDSIAFGSWHPISMDLWEVEGKFLFVFSKTYVDSEGYPNTDYWAEELRVDLLERGNQTSIKPELGVQNPVLPNRGTQFDLIGREKLNTFKVEEPNPVLQVLPD